jgi:hypothetical protein
MQFLVNTGISDQRRTTSLEPEIENRSRCSSMFSLRSLGILGMLDTIGDPHNATEMAENPRSLTCRNLKRSRVGILQTHISHRSDGLRSSRHSMRVNTRVTEWVHMYFLHSKEEYLAKVNTVSVVPRVPCFRFSFQPGVNNGNFLLLKTP